MPIKHPSAEIIQAAGLFLGEDELWKLSAYRCCLEPRNWTGSQIEWRAGGRKEKSLMTHPQSSAELKGLGDEEESAKKTEEN